MVLQTVRHSSLYPCHHREEALAAAASAVLDRVLGEAAEPPAGRQGGSRVEERGDEMGGLMEGLRRLWRE